MKAPGRNPSTALLIPKSPWKHRSFFQSDLRALGLLDEHWPCLTSKSMSRKDLDARPWPLVSGLTAVDTIASDNSCTTSV